MDLAIGTDSSFPLTHAVHLTLPLTVLWQVHLE